MTRAPTEFNCTGYIGLSPTGSGLLYPIYRANNANASFVQELGREGEITSFIPFYDYEHFRHYSSAGSRARSLGSEGLFAYAEDAQLIELSYSDISGMVQDPGWSEKSEHLPILTRLALARIGRASQSKQLDLLNRFVESRLRSKVGQKAAIAAHKRFNLNLERYWVDLEDAGLDSGSSSTEEFEKYGTEELFEWLFQNESNQRWTNALKALIKRVVYDDRLFELIGRLVSMEQFNIENASRVEKIIVARGLEIYSLLSNASGDFAEAMYDYVLSGHIFCLSDVIAPSVIFEFIRHLEEEKTLDFLPIDTYLDLLKSDTISRDLAYALLGEIEISQDLNSLYSDKAFNAGMTRLDMFKHIVANYGRLGLVIDASRRREIARIVELRQ